MSYRNKRRTEQSLRKTKDHPKMQLRIDDGRTEILKIHPRPGWNIRLRPITIGRVDFYYEDGFIVFTEKFLRERGYCCELGCRHCPYGFRNDQRSDAPEDKSPDDPSRNGA